MDSAEQYYAKDRETWHRWLDKNHDTHKSIWLVYDKGKNKKLTYDDIVEVALCYGWVDSRPGKVDDTRTKLYISKRNPRSAWSKSNKLRVKKLLEQKLIQPAGLESIKIAKANGAWDTLNNSDKLIIPEEMKELFELHPQAKVNYDNFSPSSKRIILEWIYAAKQEETKMKRIRQTVELAGQGVKANHYRQ